MSLTASHFQGPALRSERILWGVLFTMIALNFIVWFCLKNEQSRWLNVPPVPSTLTAAGFALGDEQLAYRAIGLMLQNLGDSGGRSVMLSDYDYEALARWFMLEHDFDPHSDYAPLLAAFYFGAVTDPEKLPPLIDYLEVAGSAPGPHKWRWLAHAVYLARFQMKDYDRAYDLATKLSQLENPHMPNWIRQMPALILSAKGDKQAAYGMLMNVLEAGGDTLHPNEVNFIRDYICMRVLTRAQAEQAPVCEGFQYYELPEGIE